MVLCILVFIPDLTVYSASLFVLCMISSCAFVAGQCNNKGMAWERFARLSGFVLFACRRDWPVGFPCFSAWLSLSGPFQHWNNLCWFSKIWSLIYRVLKCDSLVFLFSAGLAHWHPTDPHPIVMAAGPRCGHPQLRTPVNCGWITPGNARCLHSTGTQLEVGQLMAKNKNVARLSQMQRWWVQQNGFLCVSCGVHH